jgi:hypothetical protein
VSTKLIREGDFSPARLNTILLGDAERLVNARLAPLVAAIEELRDVAKMYSPEDWHDLGMLADAVSTVFVIADKLKEGK